MTALDIAQNEVGNKEIPEGSNWGEHVQKYLASVGIKVPASWCMAFVYWCAKESDANTKLIKTGGVLNQWNKVDASLKFSEPKIGDIFIMDFGKGLGHTGFVESIDGEFIHTIEGNATTKNGSREGIEVCRKIRSKKSIKGYIRL